jgi:tRNA (guanosine-2'-O-)-methyltransferase
VELLLDRRRERVDRVVADRIRSLTLLVEGVHDPHNLAAVLRTAEGLGLQDVHILAAPSGFRPSEAVTQGADKWLTLHRHRDALSCAQALRADGYALYASLLSGDAIPLDAVPFEGRVALVFGNEHEGVSPELAGLCDGRFRIPMHGFTQSFNVSVAVGIALHAGASVRRRLAPGGDLAPAAQAELRLRFYAHAVKQGRRLALALHPRSPRSHP